MSLPTRIIVERSPGETRAALLADDDVIELVHIRDAQAQPGAVYAGRVGERVPASKDFFIDIGLPPHGLLETKAVALASGQWVAVEVVAPARADKGHKLVFSKHTLPPNIKAPGLIKPAPDPVVAWCAKYASTITEVNVAPRSHVQNLSAALGAQKNLVVVSTGSNFEECEEAVQSALNPEVALPSGGRLSIEHTKALIAVDIDSGSSSAEVANTEAIAAIARHIRRRNLAGHIVVDLIPTRARSRFLKMLTESCADDPAKVQVMGLTPSGMIDIVRPRTRASLAETLCDSTLVDPSAETVAYQALRLACRELAARRTAAITLHVASSVAAVLNEHLAPALAEARAMASGDIKVSPHPDFTRTRAEVS